MGLKMLVLLWNYPLMIIKVGKSYYGLHFGDVCQLALLLGFATGSIVRYVRNGRRKNKALNPHELPRAGNLEKYVEVEEYFNDPTGMNLVRYMVKNKIYKKISYPLKKVLRHLYGIKLNDRTTLLVSRQAVVIASGLISVLKVKQQAGLVKKIYSFLRYFNWCEISIILNIPNKGLLIGLISALSLLGLGSYKLAEIVQWVVQVLPRNVQKQILVVILGSTSYLGVQKLADSLFYIPCEELIEPQPWHVIGGKEEHFTNWRRKSRDEVYMLPDGSNPQLYRDPPESRPDLVSMDDLETKGNGCIDFDSRVKQENLPKVEQNYLEYLGEKSGIKKRTAPTPLKGRTKYFTDLPKESVDAFHEDVWDNIQPTLERSNQLKIRK